MPGSAPLRLSVRAEAWPLAAPFAISRGTRTEAVVLVVELADGNVAGRGECVPYARYGETVETVTAAIERFAPRLAAGAGRVELQTELPAGAARNALDCALWDLEAKATGRRAWQLAGLPAPQPVLTAYTISLDTPQNMAAAARRAGRPLLKVKLGAPGDPERLRAIRDAVPAATLVVDANEGWNETNLAENLSACSAAGVRMVEQPLPADRDDALATIPHQVPLCADESLRVRADLPRLRGKYEIVNVKLDKAGGLTEAIAIADQAMRAGFDVMVGSMLATSLGVAPALLPAGRAKFVDLDGPLLLASDRPHGLRCDGSVLDPPRRELWG